MLHSVLHNFVNIFLFGRASALVAVSEVCTVLSTVAMCSCSPERLQTFSLNRYRKGMILEKQIKQ